MFDPRQVGRTLHNAKMPLKAVRPSGQAYPADHADPVDPAEQALEWAHRWFSQRGWQPFAFQQEVWAAMQEGRSGLLHATTGSGKTYAVWMGALMRRRAASGLQVLWITPMRALAADTVRALEQPLADCDPSWRVGLRTGDTPSSERARQDRRSPQALVTTPESLSLLLTRERAHEDLRQVHTVVVDEWHELLGTKRGVQVQLALARLRRWNPQLIVWGLSATLGNVDEAMATLVGSLGEASDADRAAIRVQGKVDKTLLIDTLLPKDPGHFSWGGHLGAQMQDPVVEELDSAQTAIVFTNVRSQAEIWYQLLLERRPDWAGLVAVHHGSLDKGVREWVEAGLKSGQLKAVVATSSLDLGVDFLPVERVLQIGSAKGVARLLQRAGRSGHAPGRPSRITLVPTLEAALDGAVLAQESVPEDLALKRATFAMLDAAAAPGTILASSTSMIPASRFTDDLPGRSRCLVAHPVNPPYLIPVVELSGAPWTSAETLTRTRALMEAVGQKPVTVKREVNGFILNRLQGALLAEAFRLVEDGYITPEDLDTTIAHGLGLRWSFMGPFETIDLNAPQGVADYAARFGPLFHRIAQSRDQNRPWDEALVKEVESQRRQFVKHDELNARRAWRDDQLMKFAVHRERSATD